MKISASALFIAAGVGAAVLPREAVFQVTEFSAGCIAHSTQCLYYFKLLQPGTMQTEPQTCKQLVTANNDGTLPDVKEGTCEATSRTFDVVRSASGLTFTVSQPVTPSSNQTGTHLIPSDQLKMSNEPNAVVQSYVGPTAFDLE
ncbi:hypersensitive response-inducing protein [Thozetella sp. PMI_491]|nr:hypersensitive response-inducing protein [Thozetella sp. PMI_491]